MTFTEQISAIVNSDDTNANKRKKLIAFGLTQRDINALLIQIRPRTQSTAAFRVNNLTFGVEIECYNCPRRSLIDAAALQGLDVRSEGYNHTDHRDHFKIVSDCSISGNDGNEVVSPILKGSHGLNKLAKICAALNAIDARVNRSTGLHVHFGAAEISDTHFINIVRNYKACECAIDSFMPASRRDNQYARSLSYVSDAALAACRNKGDVINLLATRYAKVNCEAYYAHRTIEFRQHSGTVDYTKIANWINFLRKLIEFSFDKVLSEPATTIESLPFLSNTEKAYFINRRSLLNNQ